ncbi:MAG: polyphosphate polymerase domain-containing protein [Bacteroidales bacterium]
MLRYERKYLVPNSLLGSLRSRVKGFTREDLFATTNGNGLPQYTVRSIYFDSPDLACYHEKHAGLMERQKLRVRGYNHEEDHQFLVLEIKRKTGNRVRKYRSLVARENLKNLLLTGDLELYLENSTNPNRQTTIDNARRFFFHYKRKPFLPTTLVTYEREAYHGKLNPGVRITFDKNIRSRNYPEMTELYSDKDLRFLFKDHFIMEVKYFGDNMPDWVKSIVQDYKLRTEALSKYVIGYDINTTFAHY